MTRLFLPLLSLLAAFFAFAAPAQAETIICPLTNANRTISNPLPSGWSVTPFAQRVTNTRIAESGTLQTLVCEYGEAGSISRAAPENTRCTAHASGFNCVGTVYTVRQQNTVTLRNAHIVHRSGTLTIRGDTLGGTHVDLDGGTIVTSLPSSAPDFTFHYDPARTRWDISTSGSRAKMWVHGRATPVGRDGCREESSTPVYGSYGLRPPAVGRYACYITADGRVGELTTTATGTTAAGAATITIQFSTWPAT